MNILYGKPEQMNNLYGQPHRFRITSMIISTTTNLVSGSYLQVVSQFGSVGVWCVRIAGRSGGVLLLLAFLLLHL